MKELIEELGGTLLILAIGGVLVNVLILLKDIV